MYRNRILLCKAVDILKRLPLVELKLVTKSVPLVHCSCGVPLLINIDIPKSYIFQEYLLHWADAVGQGVQILPSQ